LRIYRIKDKMSTKFAQDRAFRYDIIFMKYYVYILECADKTLYTGITTDLDRRFSEHKKGKGGHYTRAHSPKKIRYFEKQPSRSKALKREAQIKKMSRTKKLVFLTSASLSV